MAKPEIGIIMGSHSDWQTMQEAAKILSEFKVEFEVRVLSAHRTPDALFAYCESAKQRGLKILIAGAGGAAHLPGMAASKTELPVLAVPVESKNLKGLDSLLSIVQMPKGVPVGSLAIGQSGAYNSGLFAISILALSNEKLANKLNRFRANQSKQVKGKDQVFKNFNSGKLRLGEIQFVESIDKRRATKYVAKKK